MVALRSDHLHEPGKISDQMFREIAPTAVSGMMRISQWFMAHPLFAPLAA